MNCAPSRSFKPLLSSPDCCLLHGCLLLPNLQLAPGFLGRLLNLPRPTRLLLSWQGWPLLDQLCMLLGGVPVAVLCSLVLPLPHGLGRPQHFTRQPLIGVQLKALRRPQTISAWCSRELSASSSGAQLYHQPSGGHSERPRQNERLVRDGRLRKRDSWLETLGCLCRRGSILLHSEEKKSPEWQRTDFCDLPACYCPCLSLPMQALFGLCQNCHFNKQVLICESQGTPAI